MEDSVSQGVYLIATVFTLVTLTAFNTVVAWLCHPTLRAGGYSVVGLLEHVVQTGVVIWKAFVEVFNRELLLIHTSIVLQRLHVVKG